MTDVERSAHAVADWPPWPGRLPVLQSTRLRLRPLARRDAPALLAIYGDAEVMRFAGDPPITDLATVHRMLASVRRLFREHASLEWGIETKVDQRLVGTCGLHGFDAGARSAEMGALLARSHWGRGLMREALQAVIDWSTRHLAPQLLLADIDAPNERSRRLFTSLGFLPIGGTLHRLDLKGTDVAALPGLGPASRAMLADVGIANVPQLRRLGAVAAFARVRARSPRASLNLLWALQGALTGVDWRQVAREDRTRLLLALEDHERHARDRNSPHA